MSDTPETDAAVAEQYKFGRYLDGSDGVTEEEAYQTMISKVTFLARKLERQRDEFLYSLKMILPMAESYLRSAPSHPDHTLLEDARKAIEGTTK